LLDWIEERLLPYEDTIYKSKCYSMSGTPTKELVAVSELNAIKNMINDIMKSHCPKCFQPLEYDDLIWDDKAIWICEGCNYSRLEYYDKLQEKVND